MSQGYSCEAFAGHIAVHIDTIHEWATVHPDFSEAKQLAFNRNRIFWEGIGIKHMLAEEKGIKLNSAVWIFNMKNRFKWRDMHDVKQQIDVTTTVKELSDEELAKAAKSFIETTFREVTDENNGRGESRIHGIEHSPRGSSSTDRELEEQED
jgi:transposase